jgi:hypothetical protein
MLFVVILRSESFDGPVEDDLTDLDIEIAQDPGLDLIRLDVLALPGRALPPIPRGVDDPMSGRPEDLPVVSDPTRDLAEPGFGAIVSEGGDALLVPPSVADLLDQCGATTASELISFMNNFPSAIALALGVEPDRVAGNASILVGRLEGHVSNESFEEDSGEEFGFGALLPDE